MVLDKPVTVANFVRLAEAGDYTNTFFHRLDTGFVIQGGGFRVVNREDPGLAVAFHGVRR